MIEIAPLAVSAADLAVGTSPVVGQSATLALADPVARFSLRAKDPAVVSNALGRALPERIGTQLNGVARLGPDEWHALLPLGTPLPVTTGLAISAVDVTARAVGFTLTGPGATAALARGCPLDLVTLTPGRATRTVFETVEIQLWAEAPDTWRIEVWRSFAPWLWHSLAEGL